MPRKIPNIPRNIAATFVRQLAIPDLSPRVTNSLFVLFKFSLVGFPPDVKNHFRGSFIKKKVRVIPLYSVDATGEEK
jgi:hypothetical protein